MRNLGLLSAMAVVLVSCGGGGGSGPSTTGTGGAKGGTGGGSGGASGPGGTGGISAATGGVGGAAVASGGAGDTSNPPGGSGGVGATATGGAPGGSGGTTVASGGAGGATSTDGGAFDSNTPAQDAGGQGGRGVGGAGGGAGPVAGTASIFDGVTLNGWVQSSKMWWSVKEGTIDGKSTTGGELIMTVDDYADFRVVFSSRMPFNASGGHLGICFWGSRTPIGSYNKCKLYIPPNPWTWDYLTNTGLADVTYTTTATMNAMVWHQTELLCRLATGTCLAAVDGKLIMTYKEKTLTSIKKGPIGLQIHAGNSEVQYKDIFIDPAPKDDKLLTVP